MIEQLLAEMAADNWRLVSLSDMSVSGQPRWWATLHRGRRPKPDQLEVKFGEGTSAYDALRKAHEAWPRYRKPSPAPASALVETDEDGEGLDF